MQRDVASAYLAAGAKIGGWVGVSALVYRFAGADAFAMLTLVRATIGLLNYTSLGLAPAMIGMMGAAGRRTDPIESRFRRIYANGLMLGGLGLLGGAIAIYLYAFAFPSLLKVPTSILPSIQGVVALIGAGTLLRIVGDAPGAAVQALGRISLDNLLLAAGEAMWVALSAMMIIARPDRGLEMAAWAYAASGAATAAGRWLAAGWLGKLFWPAWGLIERSILKGLLVFGGLVVLAQLADYLYAPADYILINRLIGPDAVAIYAPALMIDSALLLLVSAIANVLLPRTALAHAAGDLRKIRHYYIRGVLASVAILAVCGSVVYVASPWIFRVWLKDPMKPTQAILPLVLIHTAVGASGGIGRSILLAIGRVRPFTISALIAGAANIALGFVFVRYAHLGLKGIVLGTIVAVVGRCVVWMPWYVLRSLRPVGLHAAAASRGA